MNKFSASQKMLVAAACLASFPTSRATVLTFEREGGPASTGIWPINYGDNVTALSYIPPNYAAIATDKTWFYGAAGGFTPNIVADFRITSDLDAEGHTSTTGTVGDLHQVFSGTGATTANDYIKVILTADPGFLVHLSSFDIANADGNLPLHTLQIIGDGSILQSGANVPIHGGNTLGVDFVHFVGSWEGHQVTLLLEATFDPSQSGPPVNGEDLPHALHISRFGLDNVTFSQTAVTAPPTDSVPETLPVSSVFAAFGALLGSRKWLANQF